MRIVMMLSILVTMCVRLPAADGRSEMPQHTVALSVENGPFAFGRVVSLTLSYRNGGKDSWVVPTPGESISTRVCYRPSGSVQHPQGYSLGRIRTTSVKGPDGQEVTARIAPNPKPISIAPGKSHDFKVAFERDWTGDLAPGVWTVWVEDDSLKLKSNPVEISLLFTADSVAACLEVARDNKQDVFKRKEHAKWLQKLNPDLVLQWWSEDAPLQEQQRKESEIQRRLGAFHEFRKDPRNASSLEAFIARINRESSQEREQ